VIFGDYAAHQALAGALGLPVPGPGEFVSARLARRQEPGEPGGPGDLGRRAAARFVRLEGADWLIARDGDAIEAAPLWPRV
jgi:hypothetical protein